MADTETFYLKDPELRAWLEGQQNKSETIKRALMQYRERESLPLETWRAVQQILESIQSVDATAHEILERIKKGEQ